MTATRGAAAVRSDPIKVHDIITLKRRILSLEHITLTFIWGHASVLLQASVQLHQFQLTFCHQTSMTFMKNVLDYECTSCSLRREGNAAALGTPLCDWVWSNCVKSIQWHDRWQMGWRQDRDKHGQLLIGRSKRSPRRREIITLDILGMRIGQTSVCVNHSEHTKTRAPENQVQIVKMEKTSLPHHRGDVSPTGFSPGIHPKGHGLHIHLQCRRGKP